MANKRKNAKNRNRSAHRNHSGGVRDRHNSNAGAAQEVHVDSKSDVRDSAVVRRVAGPVVPLRSGSVQSKSEGVRSDDLSRPGNGKDAQQDVQKSPMEQHHDMGKEAGASNGRLRGRSQGQEVPNLVGAIRRIFGRNQGLGGERRHGRNGAGGTAYGPEPNPNPSTKKSGHGRTDGNNERAPTADNPSAPALEKDLPARRTDEGGGKGPVHSADPSRAGMALAAGGEAQVDAVEGVLGQVLHMEPTAAAVTSATTERAGGAGPTDDGVNTSSENGRNNASSRDLGEFEDGTVENDSRIPRQDEPPSKARRPATRQNAKTSAWNRFFHSTTTNIRGVALLRFACCMITLASLATVLLDLDFFLRVLPAEPNMRYYPHTRSIFALIPDDSEHAVEYRKYMMYTLVAQLVLSAVGVFPIFNAVSVFVWLASLFHWTDELFHGGDTVLRMLAFFVIFFPTTSIFAAFKQGNAADNTNESLKQQDDFQSTANSVKRWPMWPFRLMQLFISFMFICTGVHKLEGETWRNGTAMNIVVQLDASYGGYFNPDFLFGYQGSLTFFTYATLAVELGAPILIWFEKTRLPTLFVLALFHFDIDAAMNLNTFQFAMLVAWCSFFIQPNHVEADNTTDATVPRAAVAISTTNISNRKKRSWWDRFFYSRTDNMKAAAFIRISVASMIVVNMYIYSCDLDFYLKAMPISVGLQTVSKQSPTIFRMFDNDDTAEYWYRISMNIFVCQAALLGMGVLPYFQTICVCFWYTNITNYAEVLWNGEDTVFRVLAFLLIFFPLNEYTIFDLVASCAKRSNRSTGNPVTQTSAARKTWPMWPFRLMQLEMCIIFFSSTICKLQGPTWRDGTAMNIVVQQECLYGGIFNPDFLFEYQRPLSFLTHSTLIVEGIVPIFLFIPATRMSSLIIIIMFHLGIDASMNLNFFHFIMIAGWLSFLIQPMRETSQEQQKKQQQQQQQGTDETAKAVQGAEMMPLGASASMSEAKVTKVE